MCLKIAKTPIGIVNSVGVTSLADRVRFFVVPRVNRHILAVSYCTTFMAVVTYSKACLSTVSGA